MRNKVNVVCLKWGTKYGVEYVNKLYSAIAKNTKIPFKFHCFTDDASGLDKKIIAHDLPYKNLEGWWNKLYLFSDDIKIPSGERIFYVDLDTLITKNIDDLMSVKSSKITVLRDFMFGIAKSTTTVGSGLMSWSHGTYTHIWKAFIADPDGAVEMMTPHGDQAWVEHMVPEHRREYWQDILPGRVVSFKIHCSKGLPPKASVVCYHGIPSIPDSAIKQTKTGRFNFPAQPWVMNYWTYDVKPNMNAAFMNPSSSSASVYYAMIPARDIFGMVGRCGGGHNTVWEDWSDIGKLKRKIIIEEFEAGMDKLCGHYAKLEQSVLQEGFRNPIIITCGKPQRRKLSHLPPEMLEKDPSELLLLEGFTGGSRLWVAQKYDLKVPCIINDFTGRFKDLQPLRTADEVKAYFKDTPRFLALDANKGAMEAFDQNKVGYHLGLEWTEDKVLPHRTMLWINAMNRQGYVVQPLPEIVTKILIDRGIRNQHDNIERLSPVQPKQIKSKQPVPDSIPKVTYRDTVVIVTGGFDPIHSGHIEYLKEAKAMGNKLVVGLNSDEWLSRKKGKAFMPMRERKAVISNLSFVDEVIEFDDSDDHAIDAIRIVREKNPKSYLVFANGGDRNASNIPEMEYTDPGLVFKFNVGGSDKKNSSSWILQEWKAPKTERDWGYYRVLHEVPGMKVKELTVEPGQSLSMQRHQDRAEYWIVSEGACVVYSKMPNGYNLPPQNLKLHQGFNVHKGDWHQLTNPYDVPCRLVEIQYGDRCEEEDIERE